MEAYVGVDVAFAKKKRLPIVVCTVRDGRFVPLQLRESTAKPPHGKGNARILDVEEVERFASETADYLNAIEAEFGVCIRRIAIDAPSSPKGDGVRRRLCEAALDDRRISCITTPSALDFDVIRKKGTAHLVAGGAESGMPAANQLWMLVGLRALQTAAARLGMH